jgi:hypothetical protein
MTFFASKWRERPCEVLLMIATLFITAEIAENAEFLWFFPALSLRPRR